MDFHIELLGGISIWPDHAAENIQHLGDGWRLASEMADLHGVALQRLSKAAGSRPPKTDEALILLGAHQLNLYMTIMSLIAKGQFDVCSHLLRASFDCESLSFATGLREDLAERFFAKDLRAAEARKLIVKTVRGAEPEFADFIDGRYSDEAEAANDLSHVNLSHVDKLIDTVDGHMIPSIGGRVDRAEALGFAITANEHEHWQLVWFESHRSAVLGEDWLQTFHEMSSPFQKWMLESSAEIAVRSR